MPRLPKGIRQADLDTLASLDALIADATKQRDELKDRVKAAFRNGTHAHGGVVITLSEARVFDAESYTKAHPVEQYPEQYRLQIDTDLIPKAAKRVFAKTVRRCSVTRVEGAAPSTFDVIAINNPVRVP